VSYQASFLRIDFRHRAFEIYGDVGRRTGSNWLAQDDAQNRCLIIQQEWQGSICRGGPDFGYFNPRVVLRSSNIIGSQASWLLVVTDVRIQMKKDRGYGAVATVGPTY